MYYFLIRKYIEYLISGNEILILKKKSQYSLSYTKNNYWFLIKKWFFNIKNSYFDMINLYLILEIHFLILEIFILNIKNSFF